MKEYRLIKKYPSLPEDWEEGMTVGLGDRAYMYSPCSGKYSEYKRLDNIEVENNPEFWQKVSRFYTESELLKVVNNWSMCGIGIEDINKFLCGKQ